MKTDRLVALLVGALTIAQVALVFVSWLLSATASGSVHSLLSAEGARWFCGSFAALLGSPLLACLLLLSMAWGSAVGSGLVKALPVHQPGGRQRFAFQLALAVALSYLVVVALLAFTPRAMLLSATGHLWPSPFSRALLPLFALGVVLVSAVYGRASRTFQSFTDIVMSLVQGVSRCAPLFVLYVFIIQFYESLRYVFL